MLISVFSIKYTRVNKFVVLVLISLLIIPRNSQQAEEETTEATTLNMQEILDEVISSEQGSEQALNQTACIYIYLFFFGFVQI